MVLEICQVTEVNISNAGKTETVKGREENTGERHACRPARVAFVRFAKTIKIPRKEDQNCIITVIKNLLESKLDTHRLAKWAVLITFENDISIASLISPWPT